MTNRFRKMSIRVGALVLGGALFLAGLSSLGPPTAYAATSPAASIARQLLAQVVLPPSSQIAHPVTSPVCQCAGTPGEVGIVSMHHYFVVPGSPTALESFLTSHLPPGGSYDGSTGTTQTSGGVGIISIDITFSANGPHLYLKQLAYSMTRRTASTSWLRVDSQVLWIPSRSAAQEITGAISATATGYQKISLMGSTGATQVHLTAKQLAKLVDIVNALPPAPTSECMENVNAFLVTLRLSNGDELRIYNGDCDGFFESVSQMSGETTVSRYTVSDRSCELLADVGTFFRANSAKGTHQALTTCEAAKKSA
ncbi:MAG: hypothetical protein ABSC34_01005 [Acidimicrobiales bacterium]